MNITERKIQNLIELTEEASFLSETDKRNIKYYLMDEDFVNERFAMITLVEIILREIIE